MAKQTPKRDARRVRCPHCSKTFIVRFGVAGEEPDEIEKSGRVAVHCMHCSKPVMITLPQKSIPQDEMLRGDPG